MSVAVARSDAANDRFCVGFRMPAMIDEATTRWPASESRQGKRGSGSCWPGTRPTLLVSGWPAFRALGRSSPQPLPRRLRRASEPRSFPSCDTCARPSLHSAAVVRYPRVQIRPVEAHAIDHTAMLERGDVHLAISVAQVDDQRFGSYLLPPLQVLAVWHPSLRFGRTNDINVHRLANARLLLVNSGFATRKVFDAACRLEHLEPDVFIESGATPTLISLAEAGHGVAIVPSTARVDRRKLRAARISCRNKPLQVEAAVIWEKRRSLPRYATGFFDSFAAHLREILPFDPVRGSKIK
jgi:DNA-binding transcriptional LysR family regulator